MQKRIQQSAVLVGLMLLAGVASAAMPTEATAAFTSISDTVTGVLGLVWPVVTTLTVGFVGIKLFKKGANKAS